MARPPKAGGKRSEAKTRKANPMGGRQPTRAKRRASPASTRIKHTEELKEAREQQAATAEILKVIASSPSDTAPVFEAIANSANRLIGGYSTAVYRVIDDVVHLVAFTPTNPEADEALKTIFPLHRSQVPSLTMVQNGQTAQIADAERADAQSRRIAHARGWRSVTFTPLMNHGAFIGFIACTRREVGVLADHHVQLLRTFADQATIAIENARLFDEVKVRTEDLRQSLEYQTATSEVLNIISRSPTDVQPVFEAIAASALRLCGAKWSVVTRFDGAQLHLAALHNLSDPEGVDAIRKIFPRPLSRGGPTDRAILTGTVINLPDVLKDPEYIYQSISKVAGYRSHLAVPTIHNGNAVGAITVAGECTAAFTERHVNLLKAFADQAVIAIENVRLFNETKEALEQQTATSEVLSVISRSAGDLAPVFDAMLSKAMQLCDANFGVLNTYDGSRFHTAATFGLPPAYDEFRRSQPAEYGPGTAPARLLGGEPHVQIIHLLESEAYRRGDPNRRALVDIGGARSLLAVPLLREQRVVGNVLIFRQEDSAFSEKQIMLLKQFAAQAVIAIENARLLNELRQRTNDLTESLQQQTATSEVLEVISASAGELEPVFQKMLQNATRICGANFGTLSLYDGQSFRNVALYNVPESFVEELRRPILPHPKSGLGTVARTHEAIHIDDLRTQPPYLDGDPAVVALSDLAGARTIVVVPMLREDELIGTIAIFRQEVRSFTDKQVDLVANFAKQVVIAIENTRLLKELRQRTDDLSRSLHELRTAQDRLVQTEKLASLGQLTAGIAHEIKNPLNFVNNFAALSAELTDELNDVLKSTELAEKVHAEVAELTGLLKDNLEKVVSHGKRADSIVKNMLLHSREGSGERRSADINALVGESLNLAYHGARAEKAGFSITLKHDFDPNAGSIDLYPQEITRALLNLISNGFYAATRRKVEADDESFEPFLCAATRDLGNAVEIRIRDNGIGISPEVREKMFNPFFTTKPTGEGTGLGLSMTHDIVVKQHGGRIDVETEPGSFTEFIITLPRDNDTAAG
jgi:two-component system NtrC family sensor kinase